MTTAFARDLNAYGISSDIIGQLVTTSSNQITWLTIAQLEEMGVVFTAPEPDQTPPSVGQAFASGAGASSAGEAAPVAHPPVPGAPQAVATASPETTVQAPQAFLDGMQDRKAWEDWYAALSPDAQAGANF